MGDGPDATLRPVLVEDDESTRTIVLNRPAARNAINQATADAMASAIDELETRDDLKVGIITGAGDHFCAGMDLKAFPIEGVPKVPGAGFAGITERRTRKPLVAAVEGYALAGGFEIALACDLIVASTSARFGLPEVTRGIVAAAGGLIRLPRRLPYHVAMLTILTGAAIDAAEAHKHGLVSVLCEPGCALAAAKEIAKTIAGNAPLAVAASKDIVVLSADWARDSAFARQAEITQGIFDSSDAEEGAIAFAEHRRPHWTGS